FLQGDAHSFGDSSGIANDGHELSIACTKNRKTTCLRTAMRISRFAVILALVLSHPSSFLHSQTPTGHEQQKAVPSTELQLTIGDNATTITQAE
ncbi:MAG TPA: hypothetical protein VGE93_17760, partial [Bryobacteraceae bacterium]